MPRKTAVTHADLEPSHGRIDLRSKTGAFVVVFTILLGFVCFTLCLIAEATRSEAIYREEGKGGKNSECVYSDNGKVPLLCASCAFVGLAIAIVVEHAYLMIAVSKSPALISWEPDDSSSARFLTWQAGFLFISTWICFAVGEILLLAGVSVESGHLRNWDNPKTTCLVIKQGLFAAAGVFALTTVLLAAALYLTAVRAQKISQEQENVRRQVLETSALYSSPVTSPRIMPISSMPRENPITTTVENHTSDHFLSVFPTPFNKTYRIL
ncbi:hypothetical protein K1719_006119 [Acacia pycnantha]|nr:hypothetical protein K1719_006119 [Acacia pycnantha]